MDITVRRLVYIRGLPWLQRRQIHPRFVYIVWFASTDAWIEFIIHGTVLGTEFIRILSINC